MESKQQTAVEWLSDKLVEILGDKCNELSLDQTLRNHYAFQQSIQMEREQHISAYSNGWHDGQDEIITRIAHIDKGGDEAGLNHFNDTYKNKAQ